MSVQELEGETRSGREGGESEPKPSSHEQGGATHRGGKVLKIGALAATAGGAAYIASRAVGGRSRSGGPSRNGDGGAREDAASGQRPGGRASFDQVVNAVGQAHFDRVLDLVMPFAENGAASAGAYVAKAGPEAVTERLLPRFIEAFNKERERGTDGRSG